MLVRLLGEGRQWEELTSTHTLGLGGLAFESPEPVGYGCLVETLISFREGLARTDGRVVWEHPRESGKVDVGVEFLRITPTDRRRVAHLIREQRAAEARPRGNGGPSNP